MNHLQLFRRFGLPVMLMAVLIGLLPTHTAQAGALPPTTAVNVSATAVRDILWVANAQQRMAAAQHPETAAFVLVLQQRYRDNATLAPATAAQEIQALQSAYAASSRGGQTRLARTPEESLFAVFAILTAPPLNASPLAGSIALAAQRV